MVLTDSGAPKTEPHRQFFGDSFPFVVLLREQDLVLKNLLDPRIRKHVDLLVSEPRLSQISQGHGSLSRVEYLCISRQSLVISIQNMAPALYQVNRYLVAQESRIKSGKIFVQHVVELSRKFHAGGTSSTYYK